MHLVTYYSIDVDGWFYDLSLVLVFGRWGNQIIDCRWKNLSGRLGWGFGGNLGRDLSWHLCLRLSWSIFFFVLW